MEEEGGAHGANLGKGGGWKVEGKKRERGTGRAIVHAHPCNRTPSRSPHVRVLMACMYLLRVPDETREAALPCGRKITEGKRRSAGQGRESH